MADEEPACARCGALSEGLSMDRAISAGWWFTPPTSAPDAPDGYCPACVAAAMMPGVVVLTVKQASQIRDLLERARASYGDCVCGFCTSYAAALVLLPEENEVRDE